VAGGEAAEAGVVEGVDTNCTNRREKTLTTDVADEHGFGGAKVNEENEELLRRRVGEGVGSDYKQNIGGVASHVDVGVGQGLGEGGDGVGGVPAGVGQYLRPDSGRDIRARQGSSDGLVANLGAALKEEKGVDLDQRRLLVGEAEATGGSACCRLGGFVDLWNHANGHHGSHAGRVSRVCSSVKKGGQGVCTQAAQGHGGPVGNERVVEVIHDLAKLVEGWHGSFPECLKAVIGCVSQFVRSPVCYPFVVELVRERQAKSGGPTGERRFPARVLVLKPFKEEWEGRHANMGDSVCCLLEFGGLDLVFGELSHPGAESASLVVWLEAATDEPRDLGRDEGGSCEAENYTESSFSRRRHDVCMMGLSHG